MIGPNRFGNVNGKANASCYGAASRPPATAPATAWQGWGTALKPAWEPIILARKRLDGTVAANVLAHGTGGLNVDGCRIGWAGPEDAAAAAVGFEESRARGTTVQSGSIGKESRDGVNRYEPSKMVGRWPANVVLSHEPECREVGTRTVKGDNRGRGEGQRGGGFVDTGHESADARPCGPMHGDAEAPAWECAPGCAVAALDRQSGDRQSGDRQSGEFGMMGFRGNGTRPMPAIIGDSGGASRFFYTSKATRADRTESGAVKNGHPTVKPVDLMRWLCRLVTPPGGTILDPFCGSGSTGVAALGEGFSFIGIDLDPAHVELTRERCRLVAPLFADTETA